MCMLKDVGDDVEAAKLFWLEGTQKLATSKVISSHFIHDVLVFCVVVVGFWVWLGVVQNWGEDYQPLGSKPPVRCPSAMEARRNMPEGWQGRSRRPGPPPPLNAAA